MLIHIYDSNRQCTGSLHLMCKHVVGYLYRKRYNEPCTLLNCSYQEGGKEFVRDIEDRWLHNEIDEWGLAGSQEFKEFLMDEFYEEIDFPCWEKPWYEEEEEARRIASEWEDYD